MSDGMNAVSDCVAEGAVGTTQVVTTEGIESVEQSAAEREAAVAASIAAAVETLNAKGRNGFVLVALDDDNTASATMAGDYGTVIHATHTCVCALGSVVKQVQGQADGDAEKHAGVADFTAGATILTMHHGMLEKLAAESAAAVKQ